MAKKKKQMFPLPRKSVLVAAAIAIVVGAGYITYYLVHNHAITADKTRFAHAGNDVETVADQIVATVGQPADRKDGGKCSYAHQEFTRGTLSCDVYAYLAFEANGPNDVNAIVQKIDVLSSLHGKPWNFIEVTEKPHEFTDGVNYSDNFVILHDIFDTEIRSLTYKGSNTLPCGISYLYFNSLSHPKGYPVFNVSAPQTLLVDIGCGGNSKAQYFPISE
jgi:hypothetical protein